MEPALASSAVERRVADFLGRTHGHLIGGEWVPPLNEHLNPVINPADGREIARVGKGDTADIDSAVRAARDALNGPWSRLSSVDRGRLLFKLADLIELRADEFALLETLDNGKPLRDSRNIDIPGAVEELREYAGWASKLAGETLIGSPGDVHAYTLREPVGVAGLIIPWNFPLWNAVTKIGPALAAGCTAILKPAEQTPLSALLLGEVLSDAGVPDGVVNIVTGAGDAGAALAAHLDVDKIAFTGSTEVGKSIIRAASGNMKRLTLELGGKSPVIVFPDADIDRAIEGAAQTIFYNSGQVCVANSRLYAHRTVFDRVIEGIAERAASIKVGPGLNADTEMGPLISERQLDRVTDFLESSVEDGATTIVGGKRIERDGYFVEPTVIVDTHPGMRIMQEEIFGPVIAGSSFDDDELESIAEAANNTAYGLAAYVWTNDLRTAHQMTRKLRAGSIHVNGGEAAGLPFGGYKQSGWGRENGRVGVEAYTEIKSIAIAL